MLEMTYQEINSKREMETTTLKAKVSQEDVYDITSWRQSPIGAYRIESNIDTQLKEMVYIVYMKRMFLQEILAQEDIKENGKTLKIKDLKYKGQGRVNYGVSSYKIPSMVLDINSELFESKSEPTIDLLNHIIQGTTDNLTVADIVHAIITDGHKKALEDNLINLNTLLESCGYHISVQSIKRVKTQVKGTRKGVLGNKKTLNKLIIQKTNGEEVNIFEDEDLTGFSFTLLFTIYLTILLEPSTEENKKQIIFMLNTTPLIGLSEGQKEIITKYLLSIKKELKIKDFSIIYY